MRVAVVALMLSMLWRSMTPQAAAPCLHFEPSVQSVVGTLVRRTYAGRPNYESIKKGDEPETGWYVQLLTPICLTGTPGDELNSEDVANVQLVQLVLTHNEYKTHKRLVGKKVKATGTFYTGFSGHHHTPVLLRVTSLEAEK